MTSPVGVTDRAASLLQTDPALGRLLGARDASAVGHRPLIPVLEIAAGPWTVPAPAALGDGTFALIVLTGALLRAPEDGDARLLGPGDLFEPWAPPAAEWVACTPVRAAVIGEALLGAVAPWPLAAAHVQLRAAARPARAGMLVDGEAAGTADHRLSELLWRLAIRWGRSDGDGVVL